VEDAIEVSPRCSRACGQGAVNGGWRRIVAESR
jgi:hypothetical protein